MDTKIAKTAVFAHSVTSKKRKQIKTRFELRPPSPTTMNQPSPRGSAAKNISVDGMVIL
jgi:hypothetical protein